jgi:hypothetical protein
MASRSETRDRAFVRLGCAAVRPGVVVGFFCHLEGE